MLLSIALIPIILCLTIRLVSAQATAPAYGQCGGQGWSGPTTCASGYTCTATNQWYSQCLPGSNPPVTNPPPATTSVTQPPTTTVISPPPAGSQIRTVTNPVYHFYLQNKGGVPQLGPESTSGRFSISGSITLNQANGTKLFLNTDDIGAAYKPLSFGTAATTTNWGLEGDAIIIRNPRQLNFLACTTSDRNFYDVFLQGQGNAEPPGRSCTMVTMHLPCLC